MGRETKMLITDLIPMAGAAFVLAVLSLVAFSRQGLRTNPAKTLSLLVLRFISLWYVIIAIAVLFKVRTMFFADAGGNPFECNIVPFATITKFAAQRNIIQLFGNIILFCPLPVLLLLNFPNMRTRSLLLITAVVTVIIEPLQQLINIIMNTNINVIDIDDFILNSLGSLFGLAMLWLLRRFINRNKLKIAK